MYALWLTPDAENRQLLSKHIGQFSEKYQSSQFEPHITLLGKITGDETELIRSAQSLANDLRCIDVNARHLDTDDIFYKRLFLKIEPSVRLDQAYQQASRLFELSDEYQWLPHLSLLYSEQTISEKDLLSLGEFDLKLNCLQLISAFGLPEEWKILLSIDLGS